MNNICKKCKNKYDEGSDGYCRVCLDQEQKNIVGNWNSLNTIDQKKEIDYKR